jgi:hypothetical protein
MGGRDYLGIGRSSKMVSAGRLRLSRALVAILGALAVGGLASGGTAQAAFPGDNGKIAYGRNISQTQSAVWTSDPDGSNKTALLDGGNHVFYFGLSFAPDGDRYAVGRSTSASPPDRRLILASLTDPGFFQSISRGDAYTDDISYSPDGSSVAIAGGTSGVACTIFLRAIAAGTEISRNVPCSADGVAWSANGDRLYAWANGLKSYDPALQDERIEPAAGAIDISPDGTRRVYVKWNGGTAGHDVYSSRLDGTDERRLTTDVAIERDPIYSPDGTKVAFTKNVGTSADPTYDVFVMNTDGTGVYALAYSTDDEFVTSWQPLNPPPFTRLTGGPSGPTNDSTPTFEFSSDTGGATLQCRRWRTDTLTILPAFSTCSSPHTTPALADGAWAFEVRAAAGGRTDPSPVRRDFVVDTVAPTPAITGPDGPTNDATPSFGITANGAASVTCWVDSGDPDPCGPSFTSSQLADGPHTLHVHAVDAAGNAGTASRDFAVDTEPPETTITGHPGDRTTETQPTFAFTADDDPATFTCRIDADPWMACTSETTVGPLTLGSHAFEVRAADALGNTDQTPARHEFVVEAEFVPTPPGGPGAQVTAPGKKTKKKCKKKKGKKKCKKKRK